MTDEVKLTTDEKFDIVMARITDVENRLLNLSQMLAEKEHGLGLVMQATEAGKEAGMLAKFARETHPYESLVHWYFGLSQQGH